MTNKREKLSPKWLLYSGNAPTDDQDAAIRSAGRLDLGAEKQDVLRYMRSAIMVAEYMMRGVPDIFADDGRMAVPGTRQDFSDGVFIWCNELPYYVEQYDLKLPTEFIELARSRNYALPEDVTVERIALPK